jgi:hypothetical protein
LPPRKNVRAPQTIEASAARPQDALDEFLQAQPRFDISGAADLAVQDNSQATVYVPDRLQDESDYRGALQRWFGLLRVGGVLVLTVPHAFLDTRQDRLPAPRRPHQKRLYTPASLLSEVEEALVPNSYRLRWLADRDGGYDYARDREVPPTGQHDIALVLERIAPPAWDLVPSKPAAVPPPAVAFEPLRTRAETMAAGTVERILLLKLDHLGDFLMAVPALHAVRAHFPNAHVTLVVGGWNEGLARRTGIADELLTFDAFPRDTGEVTPDIAGKAAQFDAAIAGSYDLAIDLRTFGDTRILLRNVDATHKAGIGHRGAHPFLDIFLPVDPAAEAVDHAWHDPIDIREFIALEGCARRPFQIGCSDFAAQDGEQVLVWGPYRRLAPGEYLFQPYLDLEPGRPGLLAYDIAIDSVRRVYGVFDGPADQLLPFVVPDKTSLFEFRLLTVPGEALQDFRFYGGKLIKKGAAATLHQSEYLTLLVELVAMRLNGTILQAARARPS